jgi:hypothetical protein
MKMSLPLLATVATLAAAAPALASPACTKEPKDKWLSEDAMKAKATELGYKAEIFKVEGNCYEIYGYNKDGSQVEVYFNPVTGAVVEEEVQKKK